MEPAPCCTGLDPAEPLQGLLLVGAGLTVSLGHCLGMCGPIMLGFSAAQRSRGVSGRGLIVPLLTYHAGRISSYVVLGGVLGLVGATIAIGSAQAAVALTVGAAMTLFALGLLGILPTRTWIERSPWARVASERIRTLLTTGRSRGHYALGVANGFLPCGPVAVVALGAATAGGAGRGALSLLLYGLGTLPALVILGTTAGALSPRARGFLDRAASGMILFLAVQLMLRGLAAYGLVGHVRLGSVVLW